MREQMQEQERREQQQKQQAAQFMQQRVPVSQTPAINVSVPASLPPATQVPMEVLKVRWVPVLCSHSPKWALCSRDVGEIFFSTKILQISFTLAWFAAWFGVPIFKIENLVSLWPFFLYVSRSWERGLVTKLLFLLFAHWKPLSALSDAQWFSKGRNLLINTQVNIPFYR